ncbi:winged helix-turn-helix domain-containing protein [Thalassotalea marina]|uniref:Transcriptional regulator n=1 Tax=Thalassotalea marina TaxID=1673741 RepID=A0A919BFN5_9GAMM|nr:winged helix-turn-helix domain-containing protein [Thalassotalea marina]GHF85729.1 transcriptional regulator [Thalassotalea marina]
MNKNAVFNIGNCKIIPIEYAIEHLGEEKQSVQPKFIEVLCYLAEHYPRVIPREELIENVWDGNSYVGEKALTNAIWHLRQKLKHDDGDDEVIETIRKVGYRLLIAPQFKCDDSTISADEAPDISSSPNKRRLIIGASLLTILFVLAMAFTLNTFQQELPDPVIEQITKNPGTELFNAPSPDGRFVVFKWINRQGIGNLYLKDRRNLGLPPQQLTYGSDYLGHSVWSTDGKYLYFSRRSISKNTCEIVRLQVKTKHEVALKECPVLSGYLYIDISPDNNTLAYLGISDTDENSGIYLLDLLNKDSEPVRFSCSNNCDYQERDFAFSPDGKTLAVTRRYNRFEENIYLVDIKTQQAKQITFKSADIVGLTWHPNGKQIVYGIQHADNRQGYVYNIENEKTKALNILGFSYPAFSFKTAELFYQQRREKYSIAQLTFDTDVASLPFPIHQSQFKHHSPDYSEKAGKLVYVSNESGHYELWLSDQNGDNRKQVTFFNQTVRYPRWSRSGKKIAFLAPSDSAKADKIYILDLATKKLSMLPSSHKTHNRPTWSWDDNAIITTIYQKEFKDLHALDIQTGQSVRLTFDGGRMGVMTSPTTLIYTTKNSGLWQREVSTQVPNTPDQKSLEKVSAKEFQTTYAWEYTPQGIYYRQNKGEFQLLSFYDFNEQQSKALIKLPRNTLAYASSLSFIPSKNSLLFTQADMPQSDIKKVTHPLILK